ncbi:MAG: thiamine pyrophosphate-binding protein, partial [Blautia sp.]|nr:thiamine pyrophosphate-binding protein [Blautia sp.]
MKTRVSDYIADWLVKQGVTDCFLVNGGGAMYLDDSLGHHPGMHCLYQHHEQACAMAAEGYARVNNKMAVVCVTTGPGATNAITGVAGAWMDSIPMLVLSGQARYATTVYASGLKLRTRGVQEFDIIGSVGNMTKYCELVREPKDIRRCLEKAYYLAREGRPGPCWLDIPLDVQSAMIDPEELPPFQEEEKMTEVPEAEIEAIIPRLLAAKRPLIYLGNGVRLSGASAAARRLIETWRVPVVNGMGSVDAVETDFPYYVGRNGTTGDRAGNFAVQTCDFLLSLGSRQSFFQTGFYHEHWAPYAYKILNDIDPEELQKDSLHADLTVCCDAGYLISQLQKRTEGMKLPDFSGWLETCLQWKKDYPVVQKRHYSSDKVNLYAFYDTMTRQMPAEADLVVSVGTSRVAGSQAAYLKKGQRFYTNPSMAAMGFDLPAAVGVCIGRGRKKTVLVTGEGSFQMNL